MTTDLYDVEKGQVESQLGSSLSMTTELHDVEKGEVESKLPMVIAVNDH